jgi:hypothetical protein
MEYLIAKITAYRHLFQFIFSIAQTDCMLLIQKTIGWLKYILNPQYISEYGTIMRLLFQMVKFKSLKTAQKHNQFMKIRNLVCTHIQDYINNVSLIRIL